MHRVHGTFTTMSPTRLISVLAVTGTLALASACGGTDPEATAPSASPAPTTPAATPTPTPTPSPTVTSTPTDDLGGDGDAEGDDAPATAGGGVCQYVGAEEVGAVLGVTVTGSAIAGQTGCVFTQGGKRGTSITLLDKSTSAAGGMDGAKTEATSTVEGEPQDLSGIGTAAFVVTGTIFGGTEVQGAGAVQLGTRIISVSLVQHSALAGSKVRALVVDLLELVDHESP